MGKHKKETLSKCKQCQFYDVTNNICQLGDMSEYNKKHIEKCTDFLIKDKFVMF